MLSLSPSANFLIAITSHQQVAVINQVPVYVITDVALIPLDSQREAQKVLGKVKDARVKSASLSFAEDSSSDESASEEDDESDTSTEPGVDEADDVGTETGAKNSEEAPERTADTVGRLGVYGSFTQRWFSRSAWRAERNLQLTSETGERPMSSGDVVSDDEPGNRDVTPPPERVDRTPSFTNGDTKPEIQPALESFPALPLSEVERAEEEAVVQAVRESVVGHSLTPKLLHTTRMLFGSSRSFFFSYDIDITRPWGQQRDGQEDTGVIVVGKPLWKKVDQVVCKLDIQYSSPCTWDLTLTNCGVVFLEQAPFKAIYRLSPASFYITPNAGLRRAEDVLHPPNNVLQAAYPCSHG